MSKHSPRSIAKPHSHKTHEISRTILPDPLPAAEPIPPPAPRYPLPEARPESKFFSSDVPTEPSATLPTGQQESDEGSRTAADGTAAGHSRLYRLFCMDLIRKSAALVIALIVFFGIRQSTSYRQALTLSVEAEMSDGSRALTGIEPNLVTVTFRGSEDEIRRLALPGTEPPRIRLQLQQPPTNASQQDIRLSRRDVTCAEGLHVVSISPASVVAYFDTSDTRTFPVEAPKLINVPHDCTVSVTLNTSDVELTGSRERMDELALRKMPLKTAPLDLSNRTGDFKTVLRVLPPDGKGGWGLRPDTVRAEVRIVSEEVSRTLHDIPVRIIQSHSGIRYVPERDTVDITVTGSRSEIASLDKSALMAIIAEPDGAEGRRTLAVPHISFPYTNRVSRLTVTPPHIYLTPQSESDISPDPETNNTTRQPKANKKTTAPASDE